MELDDFEYQRIVRRLREWALSHPSPDRPFMAIMDETDSELTELTPIQFAEQVERRTEIGRSYVSYLEEMSTLHAEDIVASIDRTIRANELAR